MGLGRVLAMMVAAPMLAFGFAASVMGLFVLLLGLTSSGGGPPTCGDEVMRPGDQCHITVNGRGSTAGYEEMVRRNESGPRDDLIMSGVLLGGGAVLLLGGRWLARFAGRDG